MSKHFNGMEKHLMLKTKVHMLIWWYKFWCFHSFLFFPLNSFCSILLALPFNKLVIIAIARLNKFSLIYVTRNNVSSKYNENKIQYVLSNVSIFESNFHVKIGDSQSCTNSFVQIRMNMHNVHYHLIWDFKCIWNAI